MYSRCVLVFSVHYAKNNLNLWKTNKPVSVGVDATVYSIHMSFLRARYCLRMCIASSVTISNLRRV